MIEPDGDFPLCAGVIRQGYFDRWFIFHPHNIMRAWSGSRWVPAGTDGFPLSDVQVCNFDSEAEALAYRDQEEPMSMSDELEAKLRKLIRKQFKVSETVDIEDENHWFTKDVLAFGRAVAEWQRVQVLREIHAYQSKRMWDGAIGFMEKEIPGYAEAIKP